MPFPYVQCSVKSNRLDLYFPREALPCAKITFSGNAHPGQCFLNFITHMCHPGNPVQGRFWICGSWAGRLRFCISMQRPGNDDAGGPQTRLWVARIQGIEWTGTTFPNVPLTLTMSMYWENKASDLCLLQFWKPCHCVDISKGLAIRWKKKTTRGRQFMSHGHCLWSGEPGFWPLLGSLPLELTQGLLLPYPGLCSCSHHSTEVVPWNFYLDTSDVSAGSASAKILQMDLLQRDTNS